MEKPNEDLWIEWQRLWNELRPAKGDARQLFDELVARYSEPHRRYHTLDHIRECLKAFRLIEHLCDCKRGVELAIWFHDGIYVVPSKENEEATATWFLDVAQVTVFDLDAVITAHKCIRATKHNEPVAFIDQQVMVDVDLVVLGQSWETYLAYTKAIRQEYKAIPEIVYNVHRRSFMKKFLELPHIYNTQLMRDRFEQQARSNIEQEVRSLKLF